MDGFFFDLLFVFVSMDPRDQLCPGNIFLFVHKQGLDMSKIIHHLKDNQKDFTQFAIDNLLGRVFYCDADASYLVCLLGKDQRCEGNPVTRYELKDLALQVRGNKEFSPAFLHKDEREDDDEDSQSSKSKKAKPAGPHWIRWVVTQDFYKKYMKIRIGDRKLVGITLSPMYNTDDSAYLCVYAPPDNASIRVLNNESDYRSYVTTVNNHTFPKTTIPSLRWFLSYLFWVKFDGDISSFITFVVLLTSITHPCGWAPCKMFIFSGDQRSGKSELLTWIQSLIPQVNMNDNIQIEALSRQFNVKTCKPRMLCHESDSNWYKKLNNGTIRTFVTDVKANKEFEKKFGDQSEIYGSPIIVIVADRTGEGTNQDRDRRHVHMAFAKEPKEVSDFKDFKLAYNLFSRLFTFVNPVLNQFRIDFRKTMMTFLSIYYPLICPTGIKVPHLFERRDCFDGTGDDASTSAAAGTIAPNPKRAKTTQSVTSNFADAVNSMAYHLALTGNIFPVEHPNVFDVLFNQLTIFSDTDTSDNKSNFISRLLQATWKTDISSYTFRETPDAEPKQFDDTLKDLYDQWHTENESDKDSNPDACAFRNQFVFHRMLAKFKSCLMIKAWLAFDEDPKLIAWPRLLSNATSLWLVGVWINFKMHKNKLNPKVNVWRDAIDVEKLGCVARLVATRLSGRSGFHGPREINLTSSQISKFLGINLSSYLGIGRSTLKLTAISLSWGSFSIIRQMVQVVNADLRPSEEQLQMLVERAGGDLMIMDHDRISYDQLLGATKTQLMDQLANFFSDPDAISKVHEEERIYYAIYSDLFSGGSLGLMKKKEFYGTLKEIDENILAVPVAMGYRPPISVFRSPFALGEERHVIIEIEGTSLPREEDIVDKQLEKLIEQSHKIDGFMDSSLTVTSPLFRHVAAIPPFDASVLSFEDRETDSPDGLV